MGYDGQVLRQVVLKTTPSFFRDVQASFYSHMTPATTPVIRLYGLNAYDRSAKARWLLTEMGVPFENRWLNREKREHESADYLQLNPMGRVPTLELDGRPIFESGAICAVLADRFLDKEMAPPPSDPLRGEFQQWMYFASATLDTIQTRIMVIEDIAENELRTKKESILLSDLTDAITALDRPLSKGDFLVGKKLTAADICVSYQLYLLTLWPELNTIIEKFPRVVAYLERMKKVPSAISSEAFSYKG